MKVLQINTAVNTGSTGRIAEDIGRVLLEHGHQSVIAAGKTDRPSESEVITIGSQTDMVLHALKTRLTDRHGFGSKKATRKFVQELDAIKPDIVGLHNIHGYYLHIGVLFEYLKKNKIPVIWTFHDCWPFTGHCTYFDRFDCKKWQTHCHDCPLTGYYPKSFILDNSYKNFDDKQSLFTGHPKLFIVTPSKWLKKHVTQSFLKEYPVQVIHNGIDLKTFSIRESEKSEYHKKKKILLGVASVWAKRKGLDDFYHLKNKISNEYRIVLIGLSKKQVKQLPEGIEGITRTESADELAEWYSKAAVFVNPTYIDNFPTTNLEALACGTPVVTYNTGGSPEAIDEHTGRVVAKGDIDGLWTAIQEVDNEERGKLQKRCRTRAEAHFNKQDRYIEYLKLYEGLVNNK